MYPFAVLSLPFVGPCEAAMGNTVDIGGHVDWGHSLERRTAISVLSSHGLISLSTLDWIRHELGEACMTRPMGIAVMVPIVHGAKQFLIMETGRMLIECACTSKVTRILAMIAHILNAHSLTATAIVACMSVFHITFETATRVGWCGFIRVGVQRGR